jgi:branched-chain amino acid transport system permease protein
MAEIRVEYVVGADTTDVAVRRPKSIARRGLLVVILIVVLGLPLARFIGPYNYVLQIGMILLMWVALSSSWNIVGGYAGYISLGHNVFFGVGAYFTAMMFAYLRVSPFVSAVAAGVFAVLVGLLFGLITLRAHGPSFIIATIALSLLMLNFFDNWDAAGGSSGIGYPLPPFPIEWVKVPFYYGIALCAIGAVYLSYRIAHSKFGLGLRALSQDETKAEVAGINTRLYKVMAFAASGFFIGIAGSLFGYSLTYFRPVTFFQIAIAAQMVLSSIIGGRATVAGPVIGAILIAAVNELSVVMFGATALNIVVIGGILLIVLLFFPQGIVGSLREAGRLPAFLDWD